jgi:hypothetical protein
VCDWWQGYSQESFCIHVCNRLGLLRQCFSNSFKNNRNENNMMMMMMIDDFDLFFILCQVLLVHALQCSFSLLCMKV